MSASLIAGDFFGIELFEGGAEGFALAEDGDPGESGLEAFEHEEFPEGAGVGFGDAPFLVVVGGRVGRFRARCSGVFLNWWVDYVSLARLR